MAKDDPQHGRGSKGHGYPEARSGVGKPPGASEERGFGSPEFAPIPLGDESASLPPPALPPQPPGLDGTPPAGDVRKARDDRAQEEKAQRREADRAILQGAEVADEAVPQACWDAVQRGDGIIALLGFSGAGKTFVVQRIAHLKKADTYSLQTIDGRTIGAADGHVDRSRQIMAYRLRHDDRNRKAPGWLLLDLPGERFEAFQQARAPGGSADAMSEEGFLAIAAPLSVARTLLFVLPALQVLDSQGYLDNGDVEGLQDNDRRQRVRDIDLVVEGMATLRDFLLPLRDAVRTAPDLEAMKEALLAFRGAPAVDRRGRLDLVARVVLTRSDAYLQSLSRERQQDFDRDPIAHIASRRPELLLKLALQFPRCAWHFVSASVGAADRTFDPDTPHWGMAELAQACLAEALPRRRAWLSLPGTTMDALRLRAWRDPLIASALKFPGAA